jgi:amino acid transporter
LGLSELCFYAIGMILGAGIYSILGEAAGVAGHALWVSFAVGGVAAALTGLSYAELATTFPKAGAEYVYVGHALPDRRWAATAIGVVLALAGAASAATVTLAFAGYLQVFVEAPMILIAVGLLATMSAINIVGITASSRINAVFTVIEVAGLAVVIGLGVTHPEFGQSALRDLDLNVLPAAALVFFAFLGFEEIANLAEEARDAARDVPRAILVGVVVSTTLYVLVALSATTLVAPQDLAASASPLALAAGTVSDRLAGVLGAVALFATANTGLIALVATSRLIFSMARGGDLPAVLARTLATRRSPWIAALATFAVAAALVPLGGIALVAAVSSFAALVAFLSVNACLVLLRYRMPDVRRPFRVPLSIGRFPVLPAFGIASTVVLLTQFGTAVYLAGGITIAIGVVVGRLRDLWAED